MASKSIEELIGKTRLSKLASLAGFSLGLTCGALHALEIDIPLGAELAANVTTTMTRAVSDGIYERDYGRVLNKNDFPFVRGATIGAWANTIITSFGYIIGYVAVNIVKKKFR